MTRLPCACWSQLGLRQQHWRVMTRLRCASIQGEGPSPGVWLSRLAWLRLLPPSAAENALPLQSRSWEKGARGADACTEGATPSALAAEFPPSTGCHGPALPLPRYLRLRPGGDERRHLSRPASIPKGSSCDPGADGGHTNSMASHPPPGPGPFLVLNLNMCFFPKETVQSLPVSDQMKFSAWLRVRCV